MLSVCSVICKKTLTFIFLSFLENLYCKLLPELFLAIIKRVYLVFCSPWPCFAIHPLHSKYMSHAFLPPCISFLLPRVAFILSRLLRSEFSIPQSPHLRLTVSCLPYPCPSLSLLPLLSWAPCLCHSWHPSLGALFYSSYCIFKSPLLFVCVGHLYPPI